MTDHLTYATDETLTIAIGDPTPWGPADHVTNVAPGIAFVSTARHGGYRLGRARNEAIPKGVRDATFRRLGVQGWYEEDCDAVIVAVWHQDILSCPSRIDSAADALRRYLPDAYRRARLAGLID